MKRLITYLSIAIMVLSACTDSQRPALRVSIEPMQGFPTEDTCFLKGVSALYAGVADDCLWMAGGCNFPGVPVADGGPKVYYQAVYVSPLPHDTLFRWKQIGTLPQASAYGVTVSTPEGLICVGGCTAEGSLSAVYRLSLQGDSLQTDSLPSLPVTLDNMAGALLDRSLYVVGGNADGQPSSAVYVLQLDKPEEGWQKVAPVPGLPRVQPVCAAQAGKLYVWGGFAPAAEGREAAVSVDGYAYDPAVGEWQPVATPRDANLEEVFLGGAAATPFGNGQILCVGGVNRDIFLKAIRGEYSGREYLTQPVAWYEFNRKLLVYHPDTDQWSELGVCEQGARAGAALVSVDDCHYIINGELKPGIRTPEINRIKEYRE